MSARLAEDDARVKLKALVDVLPVTEKQTIAVTAQKDPRIAAAVARTIARARASKTEYQPDGSAKVRVSLQLHALWDAIVASL